MALPQAAAPVAAQEAGGSVGGAHTISDVERATGTYFAYIRTGNSDLDQMSEAGLRGLGIMMFERTAVENTVIENLPANQSREGAPASRTLLSPVTPVAVDPARDELAFYPILFWTIDPGQSMISDRDIRALNNYMRNGGLLVIDTRDQTTSGRGQAWLRRAVDRGLAIGALDEVKGCAKAQDDCHVLGKSFYLMEEFPGRYAGGKVWAERNPEFARDRVSPVIVGGNEWTAAWATDQDGRYLYAIQGDEEQREHAFRFGINLVMYALTGSYKADLIHTPAILERMGPK